MMVLKGRRAVLLGGRCEVVGGATVSRSRGPLRGGRGGGMYNNVASAGSKEY